MKQERYLKDDGTDTIDKWATTRSNEAFRDIMFAQVEKYHDRLGKKDSIVSEVGKMADYMNRWLEYEKEWAGFEVNPKSNGSNPFNLPPSGVIG